MSGASANAAAKRRRGHGQVLSSHSQPSEPAQVTFPEQHTNHVDQNVGSALPTPMTALQVLQQHHVRLRSIEDKQEIINASISGLSNLSLSEDNTGLFKELEEMKNKLSSLDEPSDNLEMKKNLEDLQNKLHSIENNISQIKLQMLKIQSFAMETNLSVMKSNRRDDQSISNISDQTFPSTEQVSLQLNEEEM